MIFPSLTDAERAALEEMAAHGPTRDMATPVRGRLALYRLIDEKPEGWTITALGRQALRDAPSANPGGQPSRKDGGRDGEHGRHYGKKARDTSWFS